MTQQVQVYEKRIFDARARFTPGAPPSRYETGWLEALNYVLVGELPDETQPPDPAEYLRYVVEALDRLSDLYKARRQYDHMGRIKALRVTIVRMAADQGIEIQ